jgi:hypothetical protein
MLNVYIKHLPGALQCGAEPPQTGHRTSSLLSTCFSSSPVHNCKDFPKEEARQDAEAKSPSHPGQLLGSAAPRVKSSSELFVPWFQ